jgi:hypothetical protein
LAQGSVIAAREQARLYLRAGRFIWNATNISRQIRTQRIDLFADYEAVRIVHWEATLCEAAPRDQTRAGQSGRALARSAPVHNAVSLSRSAGIGIVRCVEAPGRARTETRRAGLRRCAVDRQIHSRTTWRSAGQTLSPLF